MCWGAACMRDARSGRGAMREGGGASGHSLAAPASKSRCAKSPATSPATSASACCEHLASLNLECYAHGGDQQRTMQTTNRGPIALGSYGDATCDSDRQCYKDSQYHIPHSAPVLESEEDLSEQRRAVLGTRRGTASSLGSAYQEERLTCDLAVGEAVTRDLAEEEPGHEMSARRRRVLGTRKGTAWALEEAEGECPPPVENAEEGYLLHEETHYPHLTSPCTAPLHSGYNSSSGTALGYSDTDLFREQEEEDCSFHYTSSFDSVLSHTQSCGIPREYSALSQGESSLSQGEEGESERGGGGGGSVDLHSSSGSLECLMEQRRAVLGSRQGTSCALVRGSDTSCSALAKRAIRKADSLQPRPSAAQHGTAQYITVQHSTGQYVYSLGTRSDSSRALTNSLCPLASSARATCTALPSQVTSTSHASHTGVATTGDAARGAFIIGQWEGQEALSCVADRTTDSTDSTVSAGSLESLSSIKTLYWDLQEVPSHDLSTQRKSVLGTRNGTFGQGLPVAEGVGGGPSSRYESTVVGYCNKSAVAVQGCRSSACAAQGVRLMLSQKESCCCGSPHEKASAFLSLDDGFDD